MRERQSLFLVLILTMWTPAMGAPAAVQDFENWRSLRTDHFYLVGNAGQDAMRQVARHLEEFRAGYLSIERPVENGSGEPTTVVVFADDRSFTPFKPVDADGRPLTVGGLFLGTGDDAYMVLTTEDGAERSVFHEYTHRVSAGHPPRPLWLEEGLAEFYSTLQVRDGGRVVRTGLPVHSNLATLRENALIGLDVLLRVDQDSTYYTGPGQALFYAQSWALTHYLLLKRRDGRAHIAEFIRLEEEVLDLGARFEAAFHTDFETMLGELASYTNDALTFPIVDYGLNRRIVIGDDWESRTLSPSDALYHLSELLTRLGRTEDSRRYLEEAIAADPAFSGGPGIDTSGILHGLECEPDGVRLTIVRDENGPIRLSTVTPGSLEIVSVDPEIRNSIACGRFPRPRRVLVRYTPDTGRGESSGTPRRVILLPE